jgi:protein gp37
MSKTKIEWSDEVWNPTRGCSRVSEGCRNCYAERIAARFSKGRESKPKRQGEFQGFAIMTDSGPRWTGKVELIESKLQEPLHWRKPRRVFVNSMSDLFHENLSGRDILSVFEVMAAAEKHTFQILTKRSVRMLEFFKTLKYPLEVGAMTRWTMGLPKISTWPLPNVWLGVSIEDQATADERIPLLLQTPAAIRFVSYEPALGLVDLAQFIEDDFTGNLISGPCERHRGLDWVIAGGESGPGARPADPNWFRSVRDQCQAARVPFFFKQWGEFCYHQLPNGSIGTHKRVGKKEAGATLDGREWLEFPSASQTGGLAQLSTTQIKKNR